MLNDLFLRVRHDARALLRANQGSTAIEYALIASLVGIGLLAGLSDMQGGIVGAFDAVVTKISAVFGA